MSTEEEVVTVNSQRLSNRDRFYLELGYKEPVDSIARIEDTAKYLSGVVTGCCGILLTTLKIMTGLAADNAASQDLRGWWAVLIIWALSLISLILVLLPFPYTSRTDNSDALEATIRKVRFNKYVVLCFAVTFFCLGLVVAMAFGGSG